MAGSSWQQGNPPEYNKSVREFDIATLDRIKKIDVEADFEVWKEYAKQADIHPAILSFLTAKPQYFYQVETTVDGKILRHLVGGKISPDF